MRVQLCRESLSNERPRLGARGVAGGGGLALVVSDGGELLEGAKQSREAPGGSVYGGLGAVGELPRENTRKFFSA